MVFCPKRDRVVEVWNDNRDVVGCSRRFELKNLKSLSSTVSDSVLDVDEDALFTNSKYGWREKDEDDSYDDYMNWLVDIADSTSWYEVLTTRMIEIFK